MSPYIALGVFGIWKQTHDAMDAYEAGPIILLIEDGRPRGYPRGALGLLMLTAPREGYDGRQVRHANGVNRAWMLFAHRFS